MRAVHERLAVSEDSLACDLAAARHDWVVVSGKMASGKDTVAELVNVALYGGEAKILRYGDLMRVELEPVLASWRENPSWGRDDVVAVFRQSLALNVDEAGWAVDALAVDMAETSFTVTAWSRTNAVRQVLQALGGHWRLPADEDYWARAAALAALEQLPRGPVLLTGGRFLPDVEIPHALGAVTVRLEVSAQTQLERLSGRDGITVDPVTLTHPGEVALDDWPLFTARVDNNGDMQAAVTETIRVIEAARRVRV